MCPKQLLCTSGTKECTAVLPTLYKLTMRSSLDIYTYLYIYSQSHFLCQCKRFSSMRFWLEIIRLDGSPFFGFEIAGANLTVRNAKCLMKEHTEWRSQEMELLRGTHRLRNEELLMDLVEDFHLADMVKIPSHLILCLELQLIRIGIMCSHCSGPCIPSRLIIFLAGQVKFT